MSLCESPLTLIEEAAHGSCRSTNSLWGGVCVSPSVFLCVCMCEGETCWALNQSEPVLGHSSQCCVGVFSVTGSHNSAFSRWFPAGLRMTCDNITVLKGQAWRELVGGLGQSQTVQTSNTVLYTHTIMQCTGLKFKKKRSFMYFQTSSIEHIANKAMQIFTVLLEPWWPESQVQGGCRNICMLIKLFFVLLQ